jgi:hypothetical protein
MRALGPEDEAPGKAGRGGARRASASEAERGAGRAALRAPAGRACPMLLGRREPARGLGIVAAAVAASLDNGAAILYH